MAEKFGLTGKNPFFVDEDDVDDSTFLNFHKQPSTGYMLDDGSSFRTAPKSEDRLQMLKEEARRIQQRSVQSTQDSLRLINDSEELGVSTAEELVRQREQLQNSERKVDEISKTLRVSQKHINSIKSVFGNLRSYFSSTPEQTRLKETLTPPNQRSALENIVEETKATQSTPSTHPGLRTRGIDFYDDDDDAIDSAFVKGAGSQSGRGYQSAQRPYGEQDYEVQLERNLDEMSLGLGRLKGLATGLSQEIDEQNEIIDNITNKSEEVGFGIQRQNKQMKKILGK